MAEKKKHLQSIHVPHNKNTVECETERMPIPDFVYISMSQHIGAPCRPLVKKGDSVKVGQPIGDSDVPMSVPIHSSVSGIVSGIEESRSDNGGKNTLVVIEADKKQELWEGIQAPKAGSREEFIQAVRASGLVGLGGAAFPTHIKYNPKNIQDVTTLIINGAECEPFITSDHRIMVEETENIIDGALLVMKQLGMQEGFIGVEDNKPDAIAALRSMIEQKGNPNIEVIPLRSRYPQGAERVMVYEVTGKTMDAGVLPADLGVILSNVTSIAFIGQYFKNGIPLIAKRITVDGDAISRPANVLCPIGTKIADVVEFCGGYKEPPKKILMGGPMMGRAIFSDQLPVIKNNNAILIFAGEQAWVKEETACINCGRCYRACPFKLMPTLLSSAVKRRDAGALERLKVMQCMECGSCSYICPARRPLSFNNKLGKAIVKEAQSK
ncbi:electron transport complex subunit RsxC [Aminipila luticellarii]|uniref:Ion-translocating oxidoreductase complex subunit C n=1 Tax=Aminipila luticellarii TaxID=2507160 RepID=A0A410PYI9_9FIRM|nr:electron transport complex subunit RsxC [Aminipila luticellarii]QAT43945.1 electron transport complex subunit RsxC [Aminipila luticellarii]